MTQRTVAFVPARSGSKRVRDKNVKFLGGHPTMAYTIAAAIDSGVFAKVIVSTDSDSYAEIAEHYGADVPFLRPAEFATDTSPDVDWVRYTLSELAERGERYDAFSILRPTSPFRLPTTIQRAAAAFFDEPGVDSLRAIEKCKQHPAKMWVVRGRRMVPLLPLGPDHPPWHSSQYAALPEVYVQNASLEIAWTKVVFETSTIAGHVVMPFFTEGLEGFDVNHPEDWSYAEQLIAAGNGILPTIKNPPFILSNHVE